MGDKSPAPPPAPNPQATAAAGTSTNVATSVANAFLNYTNQMTPEGELRYDVTDNYTWADPYTGVTYTIPRFSATQIRSPQAQAIEDQNQAAKLNLAGMANAQSGRLSDLLANEIDLSQAPSAADPNMITGLPGAQTTFGDFGQAQTEFGDAGDITRTYGAGDFSADRQRVEEALYSRLNPQLDRERANIEQRLQDQGIRYGSDAYKAAMDDYNRQANDLRLGVTQAGGAEQQRMMDMAAQRAGFENAAQQQAFQEAQMRGQFQQAGQAQQFQQGATRAEFANAGLAQQLAQAQTGFNAQNMARNQYMNEQYAMRNQPINEISALLSGSQINNPNFVNTPSNQIPTTDVAGLINNRFSQDLEIYKQQSANANAMMGGLFGLAGGLLKGGFGLMSDVREKEDIIRVGSVLTPDQEGQDRELKIYDYQYKRDPSGTRFRGPMAQDVEKIRPDAVMERGGRKYLHAGKLGEILKVA
jgi:hypothetical protein